VEGKTVHEAAAREFRSRGFETRTRRGRPEGVIHSTGHGLGLDLHEAPSLSPRGGAIPERSVGTVEPRLYYPGVGAARIGDVALVTVSGCRVLSRLEKPLEI